MADSDKQQTMSENKVQEVAAMGLDSNIQAVSKLQLAKLFEQHQKLMQDYTQLKEQQEIKDKENANQLESYKNCLLEQMQREFHQQVEQRVELRMNELMSKYQMPPSTAVPTVEVQRNHQEQPTVEIQRNHEEQPMVMDIREDANHPMQQQTNNESTTTSFSKDLSTVAVPQVNNETLKKPEWRPLPKEEPLQIKHYSAWADKSFRGKSRGKRGGDPAVRKVHQRKYSETNQIVQTVVDLQFGMAEKIFNHDKNNRYQERQKNNQSHGQYKNNYRRHQNNNYYGKNNKRRFY